MLRQPIFVLINANTKITHNARSNCNNGNNEFCHKDYYSSYATTSNNNISSNKINNVQSQTFVSMFISHLALLSIFVDNSNSDTDDV